MYRTILYLYRLSELRAAWEEYSLGPQDWRLRLRKPSRSGSKETGETDLGRVLP
eukprot:COSAG05_NODE_2356_length_3186_cov_2.372530_6_plen_53_part_01